MSDVKVTPTEADREAANAYRDAALVRLMNGDPGGWKDTPDDHLVQAFARHRLQGWNECREAAAKVADAHEASNYEQGEYGSGWDAASRSIADAIEALPCPSTPES